MRNIQRKERDIKHTLNTISYHHAVSSARLAVRWSFRMMYLARRFVRDFTALSVVVLAAVVVSFLNMRVYASMDDLTFGLWKDHSPYIQPKTEVVATQNLALAPVSEAVPIADDAKEDPEHETMPGGVVIAPAMPELGLQTTNYEDVKATAHSVVYTVKEGDTVSSIAKAHGVTIDTITWENEISDVDAIKPGNKLRILAVSGLRYKVAKGDTIKKIAQKYEVEEKAIIDFNELPANGKIAVGEDLVIPGGKKPKVVPPPTPAPTFGTRRTYTKITRGWLTHPAPGARKSQGLHPTNAVDLAAPIGTPIHAAASGTVIKATSGGWGGGYGHYIKIKHPNGVVTLYAHLSRTKVKVGQKVKQGQVIGLMGSTGRSTGSHVHFEVRGARNPF